MRDRDQCRSPSVCREKWRSLVRKIIHNNNNYNNSQHYHRQHSQSPPTFLKDISFDLYHLQHDVVQSASKDPTSSLERRLDSDRQSTTSVMSQECPLQNGSSTWDWRDNNSADSPPWDNDMACPPVTAPPPAGHVIIVKWGGITRRIGIDGSANAIKDSIRSSFGLRSIRSFWVEDEDGVVRSFDRSMPQTTYNLHIDPGVTIKLYHYDECNRQTVNTEDVTLYNEDDFHELLSLYGWQSLWEVGTYKDVDSIQDLRPMASYKQSGFKD